jgi:hypothetical protein
VAESLRLPRSKKSNRADYTTPLAALIRRMKVEMNRFPARRLSTANTPEIFHAVLITRSYHR